MRVWSNWQVISQMSHAKYPSRVRLSGASILILHPLTSRSYSRLEGFPLRVAPIAVQTQSSQSSAKLTLSTAHRHGLKKRHLKIQTLQTWAVMHFPQLRREKVSDARDGIGVVPGLWDILLRLQFLIKVLIGRNSNSHCLLLKLHGMAKCLYRAFDLRPVALPINHQPCRYCTMAGRFFLVCRGHASASIWVCLIGLILGWACSMCMICFARHFLLWDAAEAPGWGRQNIKLSTRMPTTYVCIPQQYYFILSA